jgi:hypothetical protein
MSDLGEALLDAHVEYESARLRGDALAALIDERVAAAFAWLGEVNLNQVVTPERIIGVIQRYAIELRISGGITELAGEMANVVFSSKASSATRVGDMLSESSYEQFADKLVTLESVQREAIRYLTQSAAFGTLTSRVVSRIALDLVFRTDDGRSASMLKGLVISLGRRAFPGLEERLGTALSRYMERHAARFTRDGEKHLLEAIDREWVRQMADEIWDALSKKPLADATTAFTPQDLEDFVVLGYEFWLKFRKTPYFLAVVTDVVHHLFEKYGGESVASLVLDMGVTERMIASELRTFLSPILEHASRTGFLERELRAHLGPFYRSEEALAVLNVHRR